MRFTRKAPTATAEYSKITIINGILTLGAAMPLTWLLLSIRRTGHKQQEHFCI